MTQFEKAQKSPACLPQSPQASQNSCLENPMWGGGMICKQACGSRAGRIWRRVEWPEDAQKTEGSQPVDLGPQVLWPLKAPTGSASITGFPPLFQVSSLPF